MRRVVRLRPVLSICMMAVLSCASPSDPVISDPEAFFIDATVEFVRVEGGCWALHLDDGTRYQPVDLHDRFRTDGLDVRAAVKFRRDLGSYCMIGEMVEILWMSER